MTGDLEIWLIGTPGQLDRATAALAATGTITQDPARHALAGADSGRYRTYLRIMPTAAPNAGREPARRRPVPDPLPDTA